MARLSELLCGIGVYRARERFLCRYLEEILDCKILTVAVASGLLRTDILHIVVFLCGAYVVAVLTSSLLIRIAFAGAKAYVREVAVPFVYTELKTESRETLHVIGKLIGN